MSDLLGFAPIVTFDYFVPELS